MLLAHDDAVLDLRIIDCYKIGYKFRLSVKGRILTITRIDQDEGWDRGFFLRAYLPTEVIPDFASTVYMYHGVRYEEAPEDTTKAIFHPSVTIIQEGAFSDCESLVPITIPDTVTHIGYGAFHECYSLRFIRLSTNLVFIGEAAFFDCKSIESVFLPPTVTYIDDEAFYDCESLRFLYAPETIDHLGDGVFQ